MIKMNILSLDPSPPNITLSCGSNMAGFDQIPGPPYLSDVCREYECGTKQRDTLIGSGVVHIDPRHHGSD